MGFYVFSDPKWRSWIEPKSPQNPQGSRGVLKFLFVQKIWSNYSDLTRPHPKWWFSKGNHLISGKSRLVKYYNLARKNAELKPPYLSKLQIAGAISSYKIYIDLFPNLFP